MQLRRVWSCFAALLAVFVLRSVHAIFNPQPGSQQTTRAADRGSRASDGSAVSHGVPGSGTAPPSTAVLQPKLAATSAHNRAVQHAPGWRSAQVLVLPQHPGPGPSLLSGRQQSLSTNADPLQAAARVVQQSSSGSSRRLRANRQSAHAQHDGRRQSSDSGSARAKRTLQVSAQPFSQQSLHQQGDGAHKTRVIDSGPALDAGVRLSTAELIAAGAASLTDQESTQVARAKGGVSATAGSDSAGAAVRTTTAVRSRTAALRVDLGDDTGDSAAEAAVQEQRGRTPADDGGIGTIADRGIADASPIKQSLSTVAEMDRGEVLGVEVSDNRSGSSESSSSTKTSGFSLGAATIEPGDDAWWRQVHQDPAQCGIVDAAPAAVLADIGSYSADACAQQCRCRMPAKSPPPSLCCQNCELLAQTFFSMALGRNVFWSWSSRRGQHDQAPSAGG